MAQATVQGGGRIHQVNLFCNQLTEKCTTFYILSSLKSGSLTQKRKTQHTTKPKNSTTVTYLVAGSVARAMAAFHPFANSCKSVNSPVADMLIDY